MKLSDKEKMLLAVLGGILVSISYYQFIYKNQSDKITSLNEKKIVLETKYNEIIQTINNLEDRKNKLDSSISQGNFKSREFYPTIIQEKIILQLDAFLKQSTLSGDIGFNDITITEVESLPLSVKENGTTSFQDIVNQYKGSNTSNKKEGNGEEKQEQPSENKGGSTVEMMKVTLNFKGQYDTVKSFISKIETSNRKIAITDLTSTVGYNGELAGTMTLEFYAIPKISERDSEYLEWSMDGVYGKKVPFLIQKPEVTVQPPITDETNNNSTNTNSNQIPKSDFAVIVKSVRSDLPTVMVGKANDSSNESYINIVKNNKEDIEIEFKKVNEKYYYKYKNSSTSYPIDYSSNGVEFIPYSDRIIIEITSEARKDVDDKSGVLLNIVNGTDKIVEVKIKGDDKTNPRVSIAGDSSKITITRK